MSPPVLIPTRRVALGAVLVSLAVFASAGSARADTLTLYFDHTTNSSPVTVTPPASTATFVPGPYYWKTTTGPINSGNAVSTFCVEITQTIAPVKADGTASGNGSTTYTKATLSSVYTPAQANAIMSLYAAHYDTAWNSPTFNGSTQSTAFQLALWELVYDGPGNIDLTHGTFTVTNPSVNNTSSAAYMAKQWLNSLGTAPTFSSVFANSQLVVLTNPCSQDQLTIENVKTPSGVPAPPGVLLGLLGVGGCLFGRTFRRRIATPAVA